MREAPAISRVVTERGQHLAEVTIFLDVGGESRLRGPTRRSRQEALKDCLQMRAVAVKSTGDPSLFNLRQLVRELKDTVWTVKDLGGRLLDGAEGAPPGFSMPSGFAPEMAAPPKRAGEDAKPGAAGGRFKGIVKGKVVSPECIVEVADVFERVSNADKAEMLLRKCFSRFGPVLEVRLDGEDEAGRPVASVRFASAKAAEAAMAKAKHGFMPLQGSEAYVRLRQPAGSEQVWRRFPPPSAAPQAEPPKKKLRPNERFASRHPEAADPADESERFWEAQREHRGTPAEPPPAETPPPAPEPPAGPERPLPEEPGADATDEDREVWKGEQEVSTEIAGIPELPFSQQRKALKTLRRRWHPDKNPEKLAIATRVFQFISRHDEWLAHHDLA